MIIDPGPETPGPNTRGQFLPDQCTKREVFVQTDGVNFVHEDDAWLVIARVVEHLSDHARRLANVLVDNRRRHHLSKGKERTSRVNVNPEDTFTIRRRHLEKVAVELGGDGTGQQRLAGAGRAVEQTALWRHDADPLEQLRIQNGQLDHLERETLSFAT